MKRHVFMRMAVACVAVLVFSGCASTPRTFVKTMQPAWASVDIRADVGPDLAWESVVDTLVKRFDIEIMSRQDGYIRTNWLNTWTGKMQEDYRVRVTAKFSPDRKKVDFKSEAEFGGPGNWIIGYDSRLLETVKTDVIGKIGRPTR